MIDIEVYDIVLISMITYMSGIFTGFGLCVKYKHKLFRSRSQEHLAQLQSPGPDPIHNVSSAIAGQGVSHVDFGHYTPVMASAPPSSCLKEVVIRTTE